MPFIEKTVNRDSQTNKTAISFPQRFLFICPVLYNLFFIL